MTAGPDYTQAVGDALTVALGTVEGHREYRVSPEGDATPTSGASLDDVLDAPDTMAGVPEAAAEEAFDPPDPSPVDVSAMGGAVNQWWVSDDDARETQASADAVNAAEAGAAVPGSDGPDLGWQPFPAGPPGMVVQPGGVGMFADADAGLEPPPGFPEPPPPQVEAQDLVPGDRGGYEFGELPGMGDWS